MLRGAHEEAPAMEVQARALCVSLVWCGGQERRRRRGDDGRGCCGVRVREGRRGPGAGIKEGAGRSGPSDAARWSVGSTSAAGPPWLQSRLPGSWARSIDHCGFVLFLALGRGAVAAAEFISCPPHGFLL